MYGKNQNVSATREFRFSGFVPISVSMALLLCVYAASDCVNWVPTTLLLLCALQPSPAGQMMCIRNLLGPYFGGSRLMLCSSLRCTFDCGGDVYDVWSSAGILPGVVQPLVCFVLLCLCRC